MKRTYHIATSSVYGRIVAVHDDMQQVSKKDFFAAIESSLQNNHLQKYGRQAVLIKNLKKGVTIGSDFFQIKDRK